LGIDPGLTRCGFGIIDSTSTGKATLVHVGVFRSDAAAPIDQRLLAIDEGIASLFEQFQPDAVAVERVFAQANVRTVMGTAQVSGLAIVNASRRQLPVRTYTPSEVKAAVTGSGRADKAQVGMMVTRILGLSEMPKPADAADALAIAICHLWRGAAQDRLAAAVAAARS
jgi:crossover junction endodeoxyribonuclease RuvC